MDFRDYLVDQSKQQQVRQRVAELVGDEEEREQTRDQALLNHAVDQTTQLAQEADEIDDEYGEIRDAVLAVRDDAKHQRITAAQAVSRLQSLRRQYDALARRYNGLQNAYAQAKATATDPAARRAELAEKYPSLQ